jgi:hypothetical protein
MPPPPNADDSVFHETAKAGDAPVVRGFTRTLEIRFTATLTEEVNISTPLKRFLYFALKTDKDLRFIPYK